MIKKNGDKMRNKLFNKKNKNSAHLNLKLIKIIERTAIRDQFITSDLIVEVVLLENQATNFKNYIS